MLRFLAFLSLLNFCVFRTSAQNLIRGKVVASETGRPIAGVSIFISSTSRGTVTNDKGEFVLNNIPTGKYTLVISDVGYQTDLESFDSRSLKPFYNIALYIRTEQLNEVTVRPYDKNGWKRWGEFFREYFIGTTAFSKRCKILNPEVVRIHYNKNKKILSAYSDGPILIKNRALGYLLQVNLEDFRMDFTSQEFYFSFFPLFKEMDGTTREKKKWTENRETAYYGSCIHFYRALFRNRVKEEGFSMRLLADPNHPIDPLSIIATRDSNSVVLKFDDLVITYLRKAPPEEYVHDFGLDPANPENQTPRTITRNTADGMTTSLRLTKGKPLEIFANGSWMNSDLLFMGFWTWWQKMGTLLPFDYEPTTPMPPGPDTLIAPPPPPSPAHTTAPYNHSDATD